VEHRPGSEESYVFDFKTAVENFMGKESTVKKVVGRFIEKVENQLPVMDEKLEKRDMDALRSEAHSIKGGAWNLAVQKLGDAAKKLEDSSRQGAPEQAAKDLDNLKEAYREFLEVVDPILKQ
jgi:HPt (histidine-containing phosphotransfer) domain-containing protein